MTLITCDCILPFQRHFCFYEAIGVRFTANTYLLKPNKSLTVCTVSCNIFDFLQKFQFAHMIVSDSESSKLDACWELQKKLRTKIPC